MKTTSHPLFAIGLLAALGSCNSGQEQKNVSEKKRPNILLAICDDMSFGHLSFDGCKSVKTPNIDRLAANGVYFENAYCSAPSCSPSRAAILTGRNAYELQQGAVLWSFLPSAFKTYPDILEENGYFVGFTGKGWGPGDLSAGGRSRNPAGNQYNDIKNMPFVELGNDGAIWDVDYAANFAQFLKNRPAGTPFCFWYGALEPHRRYAANIGLRAGKKLNDVDVPDFLADNDTTRADLLDYFFEIEWYDEQLGRILKHLEDAGELDNTLILVTADNGMPFPRAKANLYEYGTHLPLIAYWADEIKAPHRVKEFVSLADIAPTFLEAAGVPIPEDMTRKSFLHLVRDTQNKKNESADFVVSCKERHAWVQPDSLIFASRAIRKGDYLLIWNLFPEIWPSGHINPSYNFDLYPFGDVDDGRSKDEIMRLITNTKDPRFGNAFGKRPSYELYNVVNDPFNLNNLAKAPEYQKVFEDLKKTMTDYLIRTKDPRMVGGAEVFYTAPYYAQKGFPTGGLFLTDWENSAPADKEAAMRKQHEKLETNIKKLKEMGWTMQEIEK